MGCNELGHYSRETMIFPWLLPLLALSCRALSYGLTADAVPQAMLLADKIWGQFLMLMQSHCASQELTIQNAAHSQTCST